MLRFIGDCCRCGGALVLPNDVIAGDDDGIVVIPPSVIPQVREYYRHYQATDLINQDRLGLPVVCQDRLSSPAFFLLV